MPTHAELSAKLLIDAAKFFDELASQAPSHKAQLDENSLVFKKMASLLTDSPEGTHNGSANSELAARLLRDMGAYFNNLAKSNHQTQFKDAMENNANTYLQIASLLENEPLGILE